MIDEADASSYDENESNSGDEDDNYDLMDSFIDQHNYTCDGILRLLQRYQIIQNLKKNKTFFTVNK